MRSKDRNLVEASTQGSAEKQLKVKSDLDGNRGSGDVSVDLFKEK